jgi:hypothetical protein
MVLTLMGIRYAGRKHWAGVFGISSSTIRKHCRASLTHPDSGVALYPEWEIRDLVERVTARPGRQRSQLNR